MMRWLTVSLIVIGSLFAEEVPQEESLFQTKLPNGVVVWVREHARPHGMASIRVIWEQDEVTHTHAIDTLFGDDEEVSQFFETCQDEIKGQFKHLGVIAVGDFSKEGILGIVATHFSNHFPVDISKPESVVSILRSKAYPNVQLTLAYPTPKIELKTDDDLKKQWLVFFLQAVVQSRMMQLLRDSGGVWLPTADSHSLLPETFCKARAECQLHNCLDVLGGFLIAVQDIRKGGFSEEEFGTIKAKIQKSLISTYRRLPDSATLANYYAEQFAFGQGCPSYDFFMTKSLSLIPNFTLRDIHELVMNCLTDENRHVKFFGPPNLAVDESKVKEVLDRFNADSFVLSLEHEGNNEDDLLPLTGSGDPYARLPITEKEAQIIWEIIDTMANKNLLQLGWIKKDMERLGQKITHVHPLRFLGTIFADPHLRECMKEVRSSYLKWNGFLDGLTGRLEEEYKRNNLLPHVSGFAATIKANPEQVRNFLQKKEWEKLVKYLLKIE
jgi:hypothetical protein